MRPLGHGAMAEVWLGEDASGRRAAVKWVRADASPAAVRSFEGEVAALARLEHPGIVHLLASGRADGRPWLAMDVVDGTDLLALGEKLQARPARERHQRAREVGAQLADALDYLHRAGFIHRDLKPANVLWSDGRAVLADFGVATAADAAEERGFVGSVAWASPEALLGKRVDARADQYGLGLVLYWLLTGARPFDEGRRATPRAAPRPPSERDPTVPADLEAVILRCVALDPAQRFPDLAAARSALQAVTASTASHVAGRQAAADRVVAALDRVAGGAGVVLRLNGAVGAGQRMLGELARSGAQRRGLACVVEDDPGIAGRAAAHVARGEALLVVTTADLPGAETVELPALSVAELRRSVFAAAPSTPDLAAAAEALRAWSGGSYELVEFALRSGVAHGAFRLAAVPEPALEPWLGQLDLDAQSVACALAALREPVSAEGIERVAAAPAPESLPELERRGIAVRVGERWMLGADVLRAPLLAAALDPEGLLQRAAAVSQPAHGDDPVLSVARAHVDAGRHGEAVHTLVDAVSGSDAATHAERRLLLAALHWYLRDTAGAATQWAEVRRSAPDPRARARAGIGLGVLHLQAGELDAAVDVLHAAQLDAELAGDTRSAILAGIDLAEARALRGELAEGLRVGRRACEEARALRDGALEAKASRAFGEVCLAVGLWREAEAALADAAALARAARLDEERLAARALRAEVALDARPDDRVAASVALDRLLGHGPLLHDPEGFGPYLEALRAEAQVRLGEGERARTTLLLAERAAVPPGMRPRVLLRLGRVHRRLGALAEARDAWIEAEAIAVARGFRALQWRAGVALAGLDGQPPPGPGALVDGLSDAERTALLASGR